MGVTVGFSLQQFSEVLKICDAAGQPYILEVNPNPDISDSAGLSRMARACDWDYEELIARIVDEALSRSSSRQAAAALAVGAAAPATRPPGFSLVSGI